MPGDAREGPAGGIAIVVSTPESMRRVKDTMGMHGRGHGIFGPYYLLMQVFWFPGKARLNFAGITEPEYQGHRLNMLFGEFSRPLILYTLKTGK